MDANDNSAPIEPDRLDSLKERVRRRLVLLVLLVAIPSPAGASPEAVYSAAAPSVVVVRGLDQKNVLLQLGSGVVIEKERVVTNCHVAKGTASIQIEHKGRKYNAALQYSDYGRDLCQLLVAGLDAPPIMRGRATELIVGQRVYAIGAPRGFDLTLSEGIISSLRDIAGERYIQTSAPISPGSSGGGLFDDSGHLIGLTTFVIMGGQNLNFALPVDWINDLPSRSRNLGKESASIAKSRSEQLDALRKKGDFSGVLIVAKKWVDDEPDNHESYRWLNLAYVRLQIHPKSLETCREWVRRFSNSPEAWRELGRAYSWLGDYAKSQKAYVEVVALSPSDPDGWDDLGFAYMMIDDYTQALNANMRAIYLYTAAMEASRKSDRGATDPTLSQYYLNLGETYLIGGFTKYAIEAFEKSERLGGGCTSSQSSLVDLYKKNNMQLKLRAIQSRMHDCHFRKPQK